MLSHGLDVKASSRIPTMHDFLDYQHKSGAVSGVIVYIKLNFGGLLTKAKYTQMYGYAII